MPEMLPDEVFEALDTLQNYAAQNAAESGWDELPTQALALINERIRPDFPEVADYLESTMDSQDIQLIGDELTEAHEERRSGHAMDHQYLNGGPGKENKPEGIPSEMADVLIRVLHVMGRKNVPLGPVVKGKLLFNATRGHRHGGRAF